MEHKQWKRNNRKDNNTSDKQWKQIDRFQKFFLGGRQFV